MDIIVIKLWFVIDYIWLFTDSRHGIEKRVVMLKKHKRKGLYEVIWHFVDERMNTYMVMHLNSIFLVKTSKEYFFLAFVLFVVTATPTPKTLLLIDNVYFVVWLKTGETSCWFVLPMSPIDSTSLIKPQIWDLWVWTATFSGLLTNKSTMLNLVFLWIHPLFVWEEKCICDLPLNMSTVYSFTYVSIRLRY